MTIVSVDSFSVLEENSYKKASLTNSYGLKLLCGIS